MKENIRDARQLDLMSKILEEMTSLMAKMEE